MVNFNAIQKIHNKLMYHDECDIYEYEQQRNPNGSKSTRKTQVAKYLNVKCKISFSLRTWDTFTHKEIDTTPYEKQPKIFMDTQYKVLPGYYIEARRYDQQTGQLIGEYKGQAGLPQVSLTHQEVLLDCRGYC